MSKLKITPDIAELMGTYMEGGFLTSEELQIVHSVMNEDFMSHHLDIDPIIDDTQLSAISPIDTDVAIGTNLLSAAFAIDTIDHFTQDTMLQDSIIGDVTPFPDLDSGDIIQQQSDTCAIKSQQIILHTFGIDVPESQLTMESIQRGYYTPGTGSDASLVGELLEDHGVGVHSRDNATVYDLAHELAQGHKVIVGVDADELWRPSFFNDLFGEQANHALIVTGIDTTDPNDIRVILTDPGTGDVARSYPMAQFLDAWSDSSCMMVATDEAPALTYDNGTLNHEMINFDYIEGHIPYVGNVPYDLFAETMVPQFDDYFNQHLSELTSPADFGDVFAHMEHTFDSCSDWLAANQSDFDDDNFDDMFNDILF
jgi:hypothetical protein